MAMLSLFGCGYSLHSHASLPFDEISISMIENKTFEPKLQDRLHRALTEEFLKQGISVSNSAKFRLAGTINGFDMVGLSEKNDVVIEYRVTVSTEFRLTGSDGEVKQTINISSPFIVSFTGAEDMGVLLATKEVAEERAMADVAMEIVGALIYK